MITPVPVRLDVEQTIERSVRVKLSAEQHSFEQAAK
jgi:hypothetical protein